MRNTLGIHRPELPAPPVEALQRSRRMVGLIRSEMGDDTGAVTFERFMEQCLYAPGIGYYRSPTREFGRAGDFVTAPELSPRFSRCLARQIAEILECVPDGVVLEAGAGSGRMAADVLKSLESAGCAPARYLILEPSAGLRSQQQEVLESAAVATPVEWLGDFPPGELRGVVLANEVLDAMPASRFRVGEKSMQECYVAWCDGAFQWQLGPPSSEALALALGGVVLDLEAPLPVGYVSELNLRAPAWIREMGTRLARGVVLLIDYGYHRRELYHPQRASGTLACHYRHRVHDDPFVYPGLQDISTHVDFSAAAKAGEDVGLEVAGFTTQAEFLIANGVLDDELGQDRDSPSAVAPEIKRLILPGEMGELIKCLALARDWSRPLTGFSGRDFRNRL